METFKPGSHPRPVITQAENNTTLWIGHLQSDPTDHFAGQTFTCPSAGKLDNIQVYSSAVQIPGDVTMTLHEFDPRNKTWGPSIGTSTQSIQKGDDAKWIRFGLPPVPIYKDGTYGFRLKAAQGLIGIGEAATGTQKPFTFGHEWNGDSQDHKGHYF